MRVVELANLQREDVQIFYIRKYAATAVLDLTARTANVDIEFSIGDRRGNQPHEHSYRRAGFAGTGGLCARAV